MDGRRPAQRGEPWWTDTIASQLGINEGAPMADRKTKKPQLNGAASRDRGRPATGTYFLSIELENVRSFSEKQRLDLSDGDGRPRQWTILAGEENGTGKNDDPRVARRARTTNPRKRRLINVPC